MSDVTLREVCEANLIPLLKLDVSARQKKFVASNAVSLAEAAYREEAWHRAIYLDDMPAGFVMLYDESLREEPGDQPEVMIWRLMVDEKYQGRGIGREVLDRVVEHVRGKGIFSSLFVSYVPGEGGPEMFYRDYGFVDTGREDGGEVVLVLPLENLPGPVPDPTARVVHRGGCHCGAIRFEVDAPREVTIHDCNCSICSKAGYLHLIVPGSCFRLLRGEESLTTYSFNTGVAQHTFCRHCGIKPFYVPRSNPDGYSVNFRCLPRSGFNDVRTELLDGRNWEQSAAALGHLSRPVR